MATAKAAKAAKPVDPTAFNREGAGTYRSGDGRFTIEQASGRWLLLDGEQQDDLGLPLTRGPFDSLAAARAAAEDARSGPAPTSDLRRRTGSVGRRSATGPDATGRSATGRSAGPGNGRAAQGGRQRSDEHEAEPEARAPVPLPIEIRRYAPGDGAGMRALWSTIGFQSVGDDDDGLELLAQRNPGLVLLALQGDAIVGTALGAWDGRRGWIYHLGVAPDQRRAGLGRRLVHEVERKLRALGCPKVNVIVRDERPEALAFWKALGYSVHASRQLGREL
jgi:ribosomal protein S18 acetylase RimI-like enzyme